MKYETYAIKLSNDKYISSGPVIAMGDIDDAFTNGSNILMSAAIMGDIVLGFCKKHDLTCRLVKLTLSFESEVEEGIII